MERKSQLKTIPVHLLFTSLVSFSCSFFLFFFPRIHGGCGDEEVASPSQHWQDVLDVAAPSATPQLLWGLAGDQVTTCHNPHPPTPAGTSCLFGTSDAAGGKVRVRPVESRQNEVNRILSVELGLLTDLYQRAVMDLSPPLYEVLKPFLMDYLLLHLHLLYRYLFFFPLQV